MHSISTTTTRRKRSRCARRTRSRRRRTTMGSTPRKSFCLLFCSCALLQRTNTTHIHTHRMKNTKMLSFFVSFGMNKKTNRKEHKKTTLIDVGYIYNNNTCLLLRAYSFYSLFCIISFIITTKTSEKARPISPALGQVRRHLLSYQSRRLCSPLARWMRQTRRNPRRRCDWFPPGQSRRRV